MVVAVVAVVGVIVAAFTGTFTANVSLSTTLPGAGNAVDVGSAVQYRNVTVGKVASEGTLGADGTLTLRLDMDPAQLTAIPAGVTASVVPDTIFGTEAVVLVPPAHITSGHLLAAQVIPAAQGAASASLQDTVSSLDYILNAVHPAQLDVALTAVATALNGEGKGLGRSLVTTDTYLKQLLPQFPALEADLVLLAPVANQLAAASPALVGTLSNLSAPSQTIASDASQVHQIITGTTAAADQADQLLSGVQTSLVQLLADTRPLLSDLTQTPTELADILNGLGHWASAWSTAEHQGPYLSFATSVPVANATDIVLAALGAPGATQLAATGLGGGQVNPPTYTAANCPRYGTLAGPDCPGGAASTPGVNQASTLPSVTVLPALIPADQEQAAVDSIYQGIDGGRAPSAPAVTTLLLSPVLHQMAGAT
jgi:phospholipid/cholesterol/gamma-HCH transport system substrate-binding protein